MARAAVLAAASAAEMRPAAVSRGVLGRILGAAEGPTLVVSGEGIALAGGVFGARRPTWAQVVAGMLSSRQRPASRVGSSEQRDRAAIE